MSLFTVYVVLKKITVFDVLCASWLSQPFRNQPPCLDGSATRFSSQDYFYIFESLFAESAID